MNARELMIGDIVMAHLEDEVKATDFPVVIVGLDENQTLVDGTCEFSWKPISKEFNHIEFSDELNPIPLTPEILEKNGWINKTSKGWMQKGNFGDSPLMLWYTTDTGTFNKHFANELELSDLSSDKGFRLKMQCRYVHELQRALRCCGLNELADDFRV